MNATLTNEEAAWLGTAEGKFWTRWQARSDRNMERNGWNGGPILPPLPIRQFKFHPDRKWRVDFCFVEDKLAIEIIGVSGRDQFGNRTAGKHQRVGGMIDDFEKYRAMAEAGYRLILVASAEVANEAIYDQLERILLAVKSPARGVVAIWVLGRRG